jgi:ubiquinone/menaquinone biosynthesis C-methylase UbiE
MTDESHYLALAAAFARGRLGRVDLDDAAAIAAGAEAGLRMHRFKRTGELPRVRRVIGALRGLAATTLVDLGSGRGAFLWPVVDALPELAVIAIDRLPHRVADIDAVRRGGVARLAAARMDATALALADDAADVVTVLEVLEHLVDPAAAVAEAMRAARRAVIATVPSHADDNPEHIQLFAPADLERMFRAAGARRVSIEHVLNHMVAIAIA